MLVRGGWGNRLRNSCSRVARVCQYASMPPRCIVIWPGGPCGVDTLGLLLAVRVMDQLNTHGAASLYEAFAPAEAGGWRSGWRSTIRRSTGTG